MIGHAALIMARIPHPLIIHPSHPRRPSPTQALTHVIIPLIYSGPPAGKLAKSGKRVFVHYTGKLKSNGKVFDKSSGKPFAFRLGQSSGNLCDQQI